MMAINLLNLRKKQLLKMQTKENRKYPKMQKIYVDFAILHYGIYILNILIVILQLRLRVLLMFGSKIEQTSMMTAILLITALLRKVILTIYDAV